MAIVAGVVFIVGAVFFTGFALGRHSDGDRVASRRPRPKAVRLMPMGPPGMGPEDGPRGPEGRQKGARRRAEGAMRPDGPDGTGRRTASPRIRGTRRASLTPVRTTPARTGHAGPLWLA